MSIVRINSHLFILLFLLFAPPGRPRGAEIEKSIIYKENKTGIYLWIHRESGKFYIGSAFDIYKRFKNYYNKYHLTTHSCYGYIYRASRRGFPHLTLFI